MPKIDADRLLRDLRDLAKIGAFRTGVHRPTYSANDIEARHWVMERMRAAGLLPQIDGIGNVLGRSQATGPNLLIGSHLETQNQAGWLDGAMGVMFGLEVARAFAADPACAGYGIDVIGFADEEGHFGNFLGSRSFIGDLDDAEINRCSNKLNGLRLRDALDQAGLAELPRMRAEPGRYRGYLEAHIEQGGELEDNAEKIGVVTAIVGAGNYRIVCTGQQNHAGTTRMAARRDAGVALIRLAAAIDRRFPEIAGPRAVWTIGRIVLEPGAPSIVPGRAEMLLQFRDTDPAVLARLAAELDRLVAEAAAGPCTVECTRLSVSTPRAMDAGFQQALAQAAERHAPGRHSPMPSGAGHDAQIMSQAMPAAMLFVPSIGGISHHYDENTADADLVLGCEVFADAAAGILKGV